MSTSKLERKPSSSLVDIEPDLLNMSCQKRGLFTKRSTQSNLLAWSKETITKPLLRTTDKILKREAPDIFKLIQIYMGDRKSRHPTPLHTCLELTTKGWSLPMIRDELYLQLMKQTNENLNFDSLKRGWELMGKYIVTKKVNLTTFHLFQPFACHFSRRLLKFKVFSNIMCLHNQQPIAIDLNYPYQSMPKFVKSD